MATNQINGNARRWLADGAAESRDQESHHASRHTEPGSGIQTTTTKNGKEKKNPDRTIKEIQSVNEQLINEEWIATVAAVAAVAAPASLMGWRIIFGRMRIPEIINQFRWAVLGWWPCDVNAILLFDPDFRCSERRLRSIPSSRHRRHGNPHTHTQTPLAPPTALLHRPPSPPSGDVNGAIDPTRSVARRNVAMLRSWRQGILGDPGVRITDRETERQRERERARERKR